MGTLLTIWGFVGRVPYVKTIAVFILACLVSFAAGNYHATQHALREQADYERDRAAREEAAVSRALIENEKANDAKIKAALKIADDADMRARKNYEAQIGASSKSAADAERRLSQLFDANSKLKDQANGLMAVNKNLNQAMRDVPVACLLSPDVRRVLDEASGAADSGYYPGPGGAPAPSAGDLVAETRATKSLTCRELADGYVALADHDKRIAAQLNGLIDIVPVLTAP